VTEDRERRSHNKRLTLDIEAALRLAESKGLLSLQSRSATIDAACVVRDECSFTCPLTCDGPDDPDHESQTDRTARLEEAFGQPRNAEADAELAAGLEAIRKAEGRAQ
jgi:hypothetical protein